MSDLVRVLKGMKLPPGYNQRLLFQAAQRIEELERENARLKRELAEMDALVVDPQAAYAALMADKGAE